MLLSSTNVVKIYFEEAKLAKFWRHLAPPSVPRLRPHRASGPHFCESRHEIALIGDFIETKRVRRECRPVDFKRLADRNFGRDSSRKIARDFRNRPVLNKNLLGSVRKSLGSPNCCKFFGLNDKKNRIRVRRIKIKRINPRPTKKKN